MILNVIPIKVELIAMLLILQKFFVLRRRVWNINRSAATDHFQWSARIYAGSHVIHLHDKKLAKHPIGLRRLHNNGLRIVTLCIVEVVMG
jgi:hypothetical protein